MEEVAVAVAGNGNWVVTWTLAGVGWTHCVSRAAGKVSGVHERHSRTEY